MNKKNKKLKNQNIDNNKTNYVLSTLTTYNSQNNNITSNTASFGIKNKNSQSTNKINLQYNNYKIYNQRNTSLSKIYSDINEKSSNIYSIDNTSIVKDKKKISSIMGNSNINNKKSNVYSSTESIIDQEQDRVYSSISKDNSNNKRTSILSNNSINNNNNKSKSNTINNYEDSNSNRSESIGESSIKKSIKSGSPYFKPKVYIKDNATINQSKRQLIEKIDKVGDILKSNDNYEYNSNVPSNTRTFGLPTEICKIESSSIKRSIVMSKFDNITKNKEKNLNNIVNHEANITEKYSNEEVSNSPNKKESNTIVDNKNYINNFNNYKNSKVSNNNVNKTINLNSKQNNNNNNNNNNHFFNDTIIVNTEFKKSMIKTNNDLNISTNNMRELKANLNNKFNEMSTIKKKNGEDSIDDSIVKNTIVKDNNINYNINGPPAVKQEKIDNIYKQKISIKKFKDKTAKAISSKDIKESFETSIKLAEKFEKHMNLSKNKNNESHINNNSILDYNDPIDVAFEGSLLISNARNKIHEFYETKKNSEINMNKSIVAASLQAIKSQTNYERKIILDNKKPIIINKNNSLNRSNSNNSTQIIDKRNVFNNYVLKNTEIIDIDKKIASIEKKFNKKYKAEKNKAYKLIIEKRESSSNNNKDLTIQEKRELKNCAKIKLIENLDPEGWSQYNNLQIEKKKNFKNWTKNMSNPFYLLEFKDNFNINNYQRKNTINPNIKPFYFKNNNVGFNILYYTSKETKESIDIRLKNINSFNNNEEGKSLNNKKIKRILKKECNNDNDDIDFIELINSNKKNNSKINEIQEFANVNKFKKKVTKNKGKIERNLSVKHEVTSSNLNQLNNYDQSNQLKELKSFEAFSSDSEDDNDSQDCKSKIKPAYFKVGPKCKVFQTNNNCDIILKVLLSDYSKVKIIVQNNTYTNISTNMEINILSYQNYSVYNYSNKDFIFAIFKV